MRPMWVGTWWIRAYTHIWVWEGQGLPPVRNRKCVVDRVTVSVSNIDTPAPPRVRHPECLLSAGNRQWRSKHCSKFKWDLQLLPSENACWLPSQMTHRGKLSISQWCQRQEQQQCSLHRYNEISWDCKAWERILAGNEAVKHTRLQLTVALYQSRGATGALSLLEQGEQAQSDLGFFSSLLGQSRAPGLTYVSWDDMWIQPVGVVAVI